MKILLIHNHYGSGVPSGENQVFLRERMMLEARGHEVQTYERHSDELRSRGRLGLLHGAVVTPWNPSTVATIRGRVERFGPHVVHVHNTFPLISPSVFAAIGGRAARVLTLHNYRLFCAAAVPMRAGRVCTECMDTKSARPAMAHGCYRQSRLATVPLAASIALHRWRGTWDNDVEAFVALSEFQRSIMVSAGLPAQSVHVKPNFYPGFPSVLPWARRADRAVFVGRISEEKGVRDLLSAWAAWGHGAPELVLVGDGPLRGELEARAAATLPRRIRFAGQVESAEAQRWIAEARLLILPSIWFETFGLALLEALAHGTPCAVSNIGPLPDIVAGGGAGAVFRVGDPIHMLEVVRALWADSGRLQTMGREGRRHFEASYAEDANYDSLMKIYESAMTLHRARRAI